MSDYLMQVEEKDHWTHKLATNVTNSINSAGVFNTGVILAGYAKSPMALRTVYKDNKEVIDEYFEQVDTGKILGDILYAETQKMARKAEGNTHIIAGAAVGILAVGFIWKSTKKRKK